MNHIIHIKSISSFNNISIKAYIIDKCNFNCLYCYNNIPRSYYMLDLNMLYKSILYILDTIKIPIKLELIGGEPTLHPNLIAFCKKLLHNINITECIIYSNFSANISVYEELLRNDKINLYLSWHSTYNDSLNKQYINNMHKLVNKFDKMTLKQKVFYIIMFEHKHIYEALKIYKECLSMKISDVLLMLISNTNIYKIKYSSYQLEIYKKNIKNNNIYTDNNIGVIDDIGNYYEINDNQLLQMQLNFKNWHCTAGINRLYIHSDGKIYPCQQYYQSNINFIGSIFNINELVLMPQICKCNICNCEQNIEKYK